MQWPDATVSAGQEAARAAGFESRPYGSRPYGFEAVGVVTQGGGAVSVTTFWTDAGVPSGLDLPCTEDPELFFAEAPADVEAAKALCQGCRARISCLEGALERREPWGVWGGELLLRGTVVPRKRPRGRPRKEDAAIDKADEQAALPARSSSSQHSAVLGRSRYSSMSHTKRHDTSSAHNAEAEVHHVLPVRNPGTRPK